MDENSDENSYVPDNPEERAMQAMQNAVGDLKDIHDRYDSVGQSGPKETATVDEFAEEVAHALLDGLQKPVGFFASVVSEEAQYHTKTNLKQQIQDQTERLRGVDKQPLDEFVLDRLETVIVVKTTDHRQGADYIWDFGSFKVETRSGKDGRGHFAFNQFRDLVHESGGVNLGKPDQERRGGEEWRDFMADMIEERGETQYTRGSRTEAVEALGNKLKGKIGYGTPEGALDHSGVWVIRDTVDIPDWWAGLAKRPPTEDRDLPTELVDEIRVHESLIASTIEDADISRSAFYHELNARNLTVPGNSGASITKWVDGSDERFWTLVPDVGTPRTYVPDPNSGVIVRTPSLFGEEEPEEQTEATVPSGDGDTETESGGFDSVGDTA